MGHVLAVSMAGIALMPSRSGVPRGPHGATAALPVSSSCPSRAQQASEQLVTSPGNTLPFQLRVTRGPYASHSKGPVPFLVRVTRQHALSFVGFKQ